jgi:leader peptidase (prepilin peptidase)/N-methyltransferase
VTIFTIWGTPPIIGMVLGLAWGLACDRIAARWPAHEDGTVRPLDWRTVVVAVMGGVAGLLLDLGTETPGATTVLLAVVIAAMTLMFATDLDQRLLPDVLTYPLAGVALLAFAMGIGPFVRTVEDLAFAAVAATAIPVAIYLLSIPFGAGAIGRGDLKLLFAFGLLVGPGRLFLGLVAGTVLAAAVILVLVALRRITLKTYVPYGPFLIVGAVWALLTPG